MEAESDIDVIFKKSSRGVESTIVIILYEALRIFSLFLLSFKLAIKNYKE